MAETAKNAINLDNYKPTRKERALIEALSDPANKNKNVSELCQVAGISREWYYKLMQKPEFVAYYKKVQFEVVKSSIAKVLSAAIDFAINDPKCHQDRKMILEMADMYTEKIKQEMTGENGSPLQVVFNIPRPKRDTDAN